MEIAPITSPATKAITASQIKSALSRIDDLPPEITSASAGFDRDWVDSVAGYPADYPMGDIEKALSFVRDWIDGLPSPYKERTQ